MELGLLAGRGDTERGESDRLRGRRQAQCQFPAGRAGRERATSSWSCQLRTNQSAGGGDKSQAGARRRRGSVSGGQVEQVGSRRLRDHFRRRFRRPAETGRAGLKRRCPPNHAAGVRSPGPGRDCSSAGGFRPGWPTGMVTSRWRNPACARQEETTLPRRVSREAQPTEVAGGLRLDADALVAGALRIEIDPASAE